MIKYQLELDFFIGPHEANGEKVEAPVLLEALEPHIEASLKALLREEAAPKGAVTLEGRSPWEENAWYGARQTFVIAWQGKDIHSLPGAREFATLAVDRLKATARAVLETLGLKASVSVHPVLDVKLIDE